ncbi:MAG TPA: type VI secretion system tube protein Hcp [Gemmataceae bacterium]|jgi:type VI secretion system secreted protein Hcp|nr:type VI secretion system tube protein Hcp [Gemmataceae bacterium]
MSNTSDAYMELSDPDVWGETYDAQFGMGPQGRKLGAFEIASFSFGVTPDEEAAGGTKAKAKPAPAAPGSTKGTASIAEPTVGKFTIKKYVDKASPDLFLTCLKKKTIKWGIITVRETGEEQRKPYLVLEFTDLTVDSFHWDMNPGDPESSAETETVDFSFQTILIKYSRQEKSGAHQVVKMKGWNRNTHNDSVDELDTGSHAGQASEQH